MKKRLIPATVAALALSFSTVVAPQAIAQNGGVEAPAEFEADVTLNETDSQRITFKDLLDRLESTITDTDIVFTQLEEITFGEDWLTADYSGASRDIISENAPAGDHIVSVTVTFLDETPVVTGTLNVTINDTIAPVITAIEDQEWEVGQPVDLDVVVSETAEVDVTGLPAGVTFDEDTLKISGTPTAVGTDTAAITAKDAAGNDAEEVTFDYTVSPDTTAPVITAIANQEWEVGQPVDLDVVVSETAEVDVTGLPAGVTFNEDTLKISGTPTGTGAGTVTITATDDADNSGSTTFTYTVAEATDDDGSSEGSSLEDGSANFGVVAVGAVIAAVVGILGAINAGIIQLPPAIANLLPF